MKINWKRLIACLAIPLAVGTAAGLLTMDGMRTFDQLTKPPLSPPGWLFPVVWTILYLLMGYASYRVLEADASKQEKQQGLILYGAQLLVNFLWPFVFFSLQWYLTAFWILIALWLLVYLTSRYFAKADEIASDLLLPYILWLTFAGYLNLGIFLLN